MKKLLLLGLGLSAVSLQLFGVHHTCKINLMNSFFDKDGTYSVRIWDTSTPKLKKSNVRFTFTVGGPDVLKTSSKDIRIAFTTREEILQEIQEEIKKGVDDPFIVPTESMDASTLKVRDTATLYVPVALHCMKKIEIVAEEGDLDQQKATAGFNKKRNLDQGCRSHSWNLDLEGGKMSVKNNY
jgi:hypothetical protein